MEKLKQRISGGGRKGFWSVLPVLLLLYGVYASYMAGMWRVNYPALAEFPVQGLDVSHHQGVIEWHKIPKDRFQFVYIKATEGGDWVDPRFAANWSDAKAAGLRVGAYHFFTLCRAGKEQAQNFIKTVAIEDNALPPVVDVEFVGNCKERPAKEAVVAELRDYITLVEAYYGVKPVLYLTYEFKDAYLTGEFEGYPVWIRDVWGTPKITGWHMWQYADNARVEGISGNVDLNVMREE